MKKPIIPAALLALAALSAPAAPKRAAPASKPLVDVADVRPEHRHGGTVKATSATFGPARTAPKQRGEFQVDLVAIAFPDCEMPVSPDAVKDGLNNLPGGTVTSYYQDYSLGITWPVLSVYPVIYTAPEPLGYYCRFGGWENPIGFKDMADGNARGRKLREDALRFVESRSKGYKKGAITCYVICKRLTRDEDVLERLLRRHYPPKPTRDELERGAKDRLKLYKPAIPWEDPLWPTAIPQVHYPGHGTTLVHEIGHCLGSPDFYHESEEYDGLPGDPSLPWAYGPTGPGYCRYIHHAFVPAEAYPKILQSGDVTLSPRSARFPMKVGKGEAFPPPLGAFIPSSHPNYLFCVEYCRNEDLPVGSPEAAGLLVHVINVTMETSMSGPPDRCYTYRADDPDHKALEPKDNAYLRPGDSFDAKSNPAAILPNLIPAGIAITDIRENADGTCTFRLDFVNEKLTKADLDFSLLPQTELVSLDGILPTSFHATMNVRYRGEPLLSEYGFCYGTQKNPTVKPGGHFPLHHRDRYDARIIDLKPGTVYYVRAYAKNANGIRYSPNQKAVKMPLPEPGRKFTSPLFSESDRLLANSYFQGRFYGYMNAEVFNSANPVLAFMALANYYRALPGTMISASAAAQGANAKYDPTQVHCNPADTRPKFRMAETEKLYEAMKNVLKSAGLSQSDFVMPDSGEKGAKKKKPVPARRASGRKKGLDYGENAAWVAKCAAALRIKNPESVFFPCRTPEQLKALYPEIRRSILMSQPVLIVRQNRPMKENQSMRWPLDMAIIDGLADDEDTVHAVFPGGSDRGEPRGTLVKLEELLDRTSDAMAMFYRPGPPAPAGTVIK